jgi:hypothetical protein
MTAPLCIFTASFAIRCRTECGKSINHVALVTAAVVVEAVEAVKAAKAVRTFSAGILETCLNL